MTDTRFPRQQPSEDQLIARVIITFFLVFSLTIGMVLVYSNIVNNRTSERKERELDTCVSATDPTDCIRRLEVVRGCYSYASNDDEYIECVTATE